MIGSPESLLWAPQFLSSVLGLKTLYLPKAAAQPLAVRSSVDQLAGVSVAHLAPFLHPPTDEQEIPQIVVKQMADITEVLPAFLMNVGTLPTKPVVIFHALEGVNDASDAPSRELLRQMVGAIQLNIGGAALLEFKTTGAVAEGQVFFKALLAAQALCESGTICLGLLPVEWMTNLQTLVSEREIEKSWLKKFIFTYNPSACLKDVGWKRPVWSALKELRARCGSQKS